MLVVNTKENFLLNLHDHPFKLTRMLHIKMIIYKWAEYISIKEIVHTIKKENTVITFISIIFRGEYNNSAL